MIYSNNIYFLQLARSYPKTLLRPSNVFTLDNPDILVLNDYGLWGIYIPTKSEIEDMGLLIRRANSSRLAYNSLMKTVLVVSEELDAQYTEIVSQSFAKVCMPDDNLVRIIGEQLVHDRCTKIPSGVRQRFAKRMFNLEEYSMRSNEMLYQGFKELDLPYERPKSVNPWINTLRQRSVKDLFTIQDKGLFGNKTVRRGKFKDSLESLLTFGFYKDVDVQNGEMNMLEEWGLEPVVLNLQTELPTFSQLQRRSLMFQGIMPVSIGDLELVPQIFDDLCTIREQQKL